METVYKSYQTLKGAQNYAQKMLSDHGIILSIVLAGNLYLVGA